MFFVRIIDDNGFFVEDAMVEELTEFTIKTPCPAGFYHPRWNGIKWVEGLTREEIEELHNQPEEPTETEMVMLAIADLAETILGGVE